MAAPPIQILGAGLTGMSAAHHLGGDFELHERGPGPGGHCVTREENGFRFDVTGHLLHLRDPQIRPWVEGLVGDQCLRIARRSRVFSHGVYTHYPYQANTFGLPREVALQCLLGYLKAREQPELTQPRNFDEFCIAVFGHGFTEHFMRPYNEKLWGVSATEITAEWCSRFVPRPKLEDVIAGALGEPERELGYNTHFLYPRRGIQALTDAMAAQVPGRIQYNHAPLAIDYRRRRLHFADGDRPYEALISTQPLDRLIASLVDPPAEILAASQRLRCNPLQYLDVALRVPCGVDLHWAYVPEAKYPFYRVGCYSNFSPEMAPAGKACLYVELSSRTVSRAEEVLPAVTRGLIEMGLISSAEDIEFARLRRIEHAYVVFDHDYYGALSTITPFLAEQGMISQGRYGAWNYSSMEDALIYGRQAAASARERLAS